MNGQLVLMFPQIAFSLFLVRFWYHHWLYMRSRLPCQLVIREIGIVDGLFFHLDIFDNIPQLAADCFDTPQGNIFPECFRSHPVDVGPNCSDLWDIVVSRGLELFHSSDYWANMEGRILLQQGIQQHCQHHMVKTPRCQCVVIRVAHQWSDFFPYFISLIFG